MTTATHTADRALAAIERQIDLLTEALMGDDANALSHAGEQLRALCVASARTLESHLPTIRADDDLRQRLARARQVLGLQREQIARRSVLNEMAVRSLLPPDISGGDAPTYSARGAAGARGGVARIYAAHG
jgi:hypothetical protein